MVGGIIPANVCVSFAVWWRAWDFLGLNCPTWLPLVTSVHQVLEILLVRITKFSNCEMQAFFQTFKVKWRMKIISLAFAWLCISLPSAVIHWIKRKVMKIKFFCVWLNFYFQVKISVVWLESLRSVCGLLVYPLSCFHWAVVPVSHERVEHMQTRKVVNTAWHDGGRKLVI